MSLPLVRFIVLLTLLNIVSFGAVLQKQSSASQQILFDDFSYSSKNQMKKNGWILRTEPGWPGIPGARWSEDNVSIIADADSRGNQFVRMTSSTDGTGANTT